jgi:hypothetical protein
MSADRFLSRPTTSAKKKLKLIFSALLKNSFRNRTSTGVLIESRVRRPSASVSGSQVQDEPTDDHNDQDPALGGTGPTSNSNRQSRSDGTIPWLNSVKFALALFEKTLESVPVPGLKGAVGGVLKIIDQYDVGILPYINISYQPT